MKMVEVDYKVYGVGTSDISVYAYFSGAQKDWPPYIEYCESLYRFNSNEVMQPWMVGDYSGHAKYLICPEGRHKEPEKPNGLRIMTTPHESTVEYLKPCVAVLEANRNEQSWLYQKNSENLSVNKNAGEYNYYAAEWKEDLSGSGFEVGHFAGEVVFISIQRLYLNNHPVLVWYATSKVVDYGMIDDFFKKYAVNSLKSYDASSFSNLVSKLRSL